VLGILQPERQIGLKRIFIFLGIYLYLHMPRGAPDSTDAHREKIESVFIRVICGK
jgi:hypothetical protein